MKVKLFCMSNLLGQLQQDKNAHILEDRINAWLSENPHIKVIDINQSSSGGSVGPSMWFLSVWYEEDAA